MSVVHWIYSVCCSWMYLYFNSHLGHKDSIYPIECTYYYNRQSYFPPLLISYLTELPQDCWICPMSTSMRLLYVSIAPCYLIRSPYYAPSHLVSTPLGVLCLLTITCSSGLNFSTVVSTWTSLSCISVDLLLPGHYWLGTGQPHGADRLCLPLISPLPVSGQFPCVVR